jgi:hypothetical protein
MSVHPRLLLALAWIAGVGSVYLVLAMFTQGMLGGVSPEEIWWDRVYAWWGDFLAAGWLMMAAIYLEGNHEVSRIGPVCRATREPFGGWCCSPLAMSC